MNSIILIGRLARDPEYDNTGTPRVNFTVGVDRRSTRDGDKVDWFRCVAWDGERVKTATQIRDYFSKGKPIIITGRMENEPYTDKDGKLRDSWAVKVERWEFTINDPKSQKGTTETDSFKAAADDIPF